MKKMTIKRISFIAAFASIATLLYCVDLFKIKGVPIFPLFLEINFSMVPIIICAFMLGPWDAAICVVVRCLLKWIIPPGSGTGYVGEVADLLIGLISCIPCGLIYQKLNCKHKTLFAFIALCICWVLAGVLSNIFINIPWYKEFYFKGDLGGIIGMSNVAFNLISFGAIPVDSINEANFMFYYITIAVIPFNLMLSLGVTLITALIHKRLRALYDMI